MDEERHGLRMAKIGVEAEAFHRTLFGKYLIERADELIEAQTVRLIQCRIDDKACNIEARNGIQLGALFKQWLQDAIEEGQAAHMQLKQEDALS